MYHRWVRSRRKYNVILFLDAGRLRIVRESRTLQSWRTARCELSYSSARYRFLITLSTPLCFTTTIDQAMDGLAYSFTTITVSSSCLLFGQFSGSVINNWLVSGRSQNTRGSQDSFQNKKQDLEAKLKGYHRSIIFDSIAIALACFFYAGALVAYFIGPRNWRPEVTFALLLGPPGAILRFELARLNSRGKFRDRFPMGTFIANMLGTGVLAASYAVQRTSYRTGLSDTGCNAMIGIEQGFCGCLTTVSTFVVEVKAIDRRRWKVAYALSSVILGHILVLAIVGGVKWSPQGLGPFCHL